jgi:DNA polymerase I-like protein with 3'-5' exonuclease and polymerase domains
LQQIPHRNAELAEEIRGCFIPEKHQLWAKADYSQQEYRLIVHFAESVGMTKASEAAQKYRDDPDTDFHQMVADMTGLDRKPAKDCNFAKAYGAGIKKFAMMIRKSEDEAARIMRQYDERMPFVKELFDYCSSLAETRGYIKLLDGARIRFDWWFCGYRQHGVQWNKEDNTALCRYQEAVRRVQDKNHPWYGMTPRRAGGNKGLNSLIQGGAARQTKLAMWYCFKAGLIPLVQVHDELCFSVPNKKMGERIVEIMRDAVKLNVPMKVDITYGISWAGN